MGFATWQEKFRIGVEGIDEDHKLLFDLVNQFHAAYAKGQGQQEMERAFVVLSDYVDRHFRAEEEFMAAQGYVGLERHRAAHDALRQEVHDLHDRFRSGERGGLGLELLAFLKNWLHFHIMEDDMAYKRILGL